ncbi:MAG: class I SAM-dependent methyltransferase [Terriglobia bacterium]
MASSPSPSLSGEFLEEYRTEDSIRRYTRPTAGAGIRYLLDEVYGRIYLDVIEKYVPEPKLKKGIRVCEFGCGGGMNLIHLVSAIEQRGIALDCAYGTDFSGELLEAARREAKRDLAPKQQAKVRFCVARNENLIDDLAQAIDTGKGALRGSFDLLVGVNTIRYCHRLRNQDECVRAIYDLLTDGGVCVVVDMNDKFPAFRSRLRDRFTKSDEALYLPSLKQYAAPFHAAGFDVLTEKHFCWVPHSAGRSLTAAMRVLTPVLNALVPERAMRSLIIARKNGTGRA